MKKIFILFTLFSSLLWSASLSSAEITEMISKIKEERVGISIEKLESTVNPFIVIQIKKEENLTKEKEAVMVVEEVIIEPTYSLDAILNHAVFINKKWYKKGSKIDQYRVTYIGKKTVTLKSSEKEKILSLKKKKYIKLH
jgi:NCAIR mutase (PurE)-related protein